MPLEKYFCEYCEKAFNDTPQMRKKHNESRYHKMMVKLHYDSFRGNGATTVSIYFFLNFFYFLLTQIGFFSLNHFLDPAELLAEEGGKPPCQTFMNTGQCPFGTSCRYSHLPQYYPFKGKKKFNV